jgi:putative sigma-54 modulation protein
MTRYKRRLIDRTRQDVSFADELRAFEDIDEQYEEEGGLKITRTKRFSVKPMDAEEAVMQMEMLGHSFFVFRNAQSDGVNVVYKRKDGTYGLIDPED